MDGPSDDPIGDRQAILETLQRHQVDFVLIGGVAAQTHGWTGQTQDIDVTPAADDTNLARLAGAAREMSALLRVAGYEQGFDPPGGIDERTFRAMQSVSLLTRHGQIDVAMIPDGTRGYDDLARRATYERAANTTLTVLVAHPDDIVRSKTSAGRAKDRAQLPAMIEDFARPHDDNTRDRAAEAPERLDRDHDTGLEL